MKIALWCGVGLLAVVVLTTFGLYLAYDARFYPDPPPADYPHPASAVEAQRQDVDYYRKLIALDRAFSAAARAEAGARLDALADSNNVLEPDHLRIELLQIAALADNGHTGVHSDASRNGLPRLLPIRVSEFADGYRVMQTEPGSADLLGTRVVAIEGIPVNHVVQRLESLRGGAAAFRHHYATMVLNAASYLHGLDIAPSAEASTWTFERNDGSTVERTFVSYQVGAEDPMPDPWRVRSPEPLPGDRQWTVFRPAAPLAVTYQSPDRIFRQVAVPHTCVRLVQLKANQDAGGEQIGPFLRQAEIDLRANPPCAILLDLRQDGGGDYTTTASFAEVLPELTAPGGDIYVLIGPGTFSAGITTAAFAKQSDPGRVRLLGQPVGDRMAFWAEGGSGCLPNAPVCFHFSTARHDYGRDCNDWRTCFWLNWIFPARVDSLAPENLVPDTFAAYAHGHDPVLESALALIDGDLGE